MTVQTPVFHNFFASFSQIFMNTFHNTLNIRPCALFPIILAFNPRPSSPRTPSVATTARAASRYPIRVSSTCLYVLTTRGELETTSEMTDATKPINACLKICWPTFIGGGRDLSSWLYVPNQKVAAAVPHAPYHKVPRPYVLIRLPRIPTRACLAPAMSS